VTESSPQGHVHKHILHEHCAQQWFIHTQKTVCPHCKHDFFDIEGALQHDVVNDAVQWSQPPERRVAALNALTHLPEEQPLGPSIARALVWSLVDSRPEVVVAAARAISHFAAQLWGLLEPMVRELLCERLLYCLRCAASDDAKAEISFAISALRCNDDGLCALIAAGALQAIADALRSSASNDAKELMEDSLKYILFSIMRIAYKDDGHRALIAAGAVQAIADAMKSATESDYLNSNISSAMSALARNDDGRRALIAKTKADILCAINVYRDDDVRALIATGACEAIADYLSSANHADFAEISSAIINLAPCPNCHSGGYQDLSCYDCSGRY
jgi:hypothetical protein